MNLSDDCQVIKDQFLTPHKMDQHEIEQLMDQVKSIERQVEMQAKISNQEFEIM